MPFIPHTETDVSAMLAAIGVNAIDDLFDEIPQALRSHGLTQVPEGMSEMEVARLMQERAEIDGRYLNFIGAGAYEHHIPAAVWQIVTRGEYYSAYTPYQAEASQGTLQLLYEYQTMMASLTGMDVSNASLYDGASGLAEAVLMAVRAHRDARRILMPKTVHPHYRRVVQSIVSAQNIELVEIDYDAKTGVVGNLTGDAFAALVIPQPNFFGCLEDVDRLTDWAHAKGGLVIGLVNPTALALLKPPGLWGAKGADIAVGEGQPLGAPLSSRRPVFRFHVLQASLGAADAGPHYRPHRRSGWQARFYADLASARTAYSPCQSDFQYLYQSRFAGDGGHDLYVAARPRRIEARRYCVARQHAATGRKIDADSRCALGV